MTNTRARELIDSGYRMPAPDGTPDEVKFIGNRINNRVRSKKLGKIESNTCSFFYILPSFTLKPYLISVGYR